MDPILIEPLSTNEIKVYVRTDGSLCIAQVVTDDSGVEELEEV